MLKLLFLTTTLLSSAVLADKEAVANNLSRFFGDIDQANIVPSSFTGAYEVILHSPIDSILVSKDGRYLIQGDVVDLTTRKLMPANPRVKLIKKTLINTIAEQDKIIYKADNEKHVIHVFTDVDCPFCRKLHLGMSKMNDLGITVKYLAAPLASLHPKAQSKMQRIWCAADRKQAMDNYKHNGKLPETKDCKNPVATQLRISQQLGVNGTPAIFLADGTHLPGYLKPSALIKEIQQSLGQ